MLKHKRRSQKKRIASAITKRKEKREKRKKEKKLAVDIVMDACRFVKSFRSEPPIMDGKKVDESNQMAA
jgi:hypothetical protein